MQKSQYYIYTLMVIALLAGCAEDNVTLEPQERDVHFCVRTTWQNGLSDGCATRVLAEDLLTGEIGDIIINTDNYPATIDVKCSDETKITLTKDSALCGTHTKFWSYTPSVIYKDNKIIREELSFSATAVIDSIANDAPESTRDVLTGKATKDDLHDAHMQLTLHHTKALVRFGFMVPEKYDSIRYILLTSIKLNGSDCVLVNKILNKTASTFIAYAYVDPAVVTIEKENTLACTYNIYDKDAEFIPDAKGVISSDAITTNESHLTRKDVTAQNKFTFNQLKDIKDVKVNVIEAGYYYNLKVTLNPDYLYVLSEHDNKQHITIE